MAELDLNVAGINKNYARTASVTAEVVGVRCADGADYEPGNWRLGTVGARGRLLFEREGWDVGLWRAAFEKALFPGGVTPRGLCCSAFTTGIGPVEREGDVLTLTSENSIWTFTILNGADEAAYDAAWEAHVEEVNEERKRRVEEVRRQHAAAHECAQALARPEKVTEHRENVYHHVETYEDIYWLADTALKLRQDTVTPREASLDRDYLVSAIALFFEFHEMFEHWYRKRDEDVEQETHFASLDRLFSTLDASSFGIMVSKCFHDGCKWVREDQRWVIDPEMVRHRNSMTFAQWNRTQKLYYKEDRDASFERVGRLVHYLCGEGYERLCQECAKSKVEADILESMM